MGESGFLSKNSTGPAESFIFGATSNGPPTHHCCSRGSTSQNSLAEASVKNCLYLCLLYSLGLNSLTTQRH
ncbi:unnamed protein product [Citrullus colocynthis]|uniref:Uncharacterized protein n=1 Tax=Citrullus colocynthis TaxID=252529 RepID=A0ABP0YAN1_9ROSI